MLILMLMLKDCVSDFIMRNSCVVFCLFFSVLSVSSEKRSRIRFYPDDTNTTCLGIVCPRNFIFVPCTLGDGKKDTCVGCPLDGPISVEKFNSALFSEPPDNICKDPDKICVCPDEAKLMNPEECLNNLNPKCQCDVSRGYIGSDPKLCRLSENPCSSTGFELALNGSCLKCSDDKYKDQIGYGKCEQQPKCEHPYVVNQQGDFRTKRTCKLQPTVNTPFPGKKTSVSNSIPTTDKRYTSIPTSSATVNDTSTNSTSEEEPSSNDNLIWTFIVVLIGLTGICTTVMICYFVLEKMRRRRMEDGEVEDPGILMLLRNKFGKRSNPGNFSHSIELRNIDQSNSSSKDSQKKSEETDSLLQDTTLKLNDTVDKDHFYLVDDCTDQLNTIRNSDHDVAQTRQTSESGRSFRGAGNSGILDISLIGAEQLSNESCQASGSGVKSGKTKNDSSETLLQAIHHVHRQLENHSDTLKNVESVVTKLIPNQINSESVKSKNASVQTVDNVLDSCEEPHDTGQLSQSPGNIVTHYNRSNSVDTDLKKEISSEDTNVKASDQEPTSNVPHLHVDSMLSGGNTSSSGPSDVYCLRWQSPGDDRPRIGRIEYMYWDNQLHCLKSGVLTDLVSGKVLLEVPLNETKKYMTRFVVYIVPDNGNGGIEPFRQVDLEHLEDEIDINSLKKSGATVLHLESFEIIDLQRPEENSAHFGQPLSEQPHHMPLPHAQNQSDSGIDNNTGNDEVQNGDQFNSLCLGSFENDN